MDMDRSFNIGRVQSGLAFLLSLLICATALRLGSILTTPNLGWYATLAKPTFNPPNWAFPVAWTIIFCLMALSLWLIVRASGGWIASNRALLPFGVQLVLNVAWSYAFFAHQSPLSGVCVIIALIAAIIWTIVAFARRDRLAAWLLAPYLGWVMFATVLNVAIWRLNA
jgi:translocator protein